MIEIESLGNLGQWLKSARQMAGLSVQTLAEKIGEDPAILEQREAWGYPGITIVDAASILRACGLAVRITITPLPKLCESRERQ